MTSKQKQQYNFMLLTLRKIAKHYMTPDQLRRNSEKEYGLDYEEALGYAYENIQQDAKNAIYRVSEIK